MIQKAEWKDLLKTERHLMGKPFFFGLGFIKLHLGEHFQNMRMHFYNPTLIGATVRDEDLHNHRYDFTSHILKGELVQFEYTFEANDIGEYGAFVVNCKEGEPLPTEPRARGDIIEIGNQTFATGSSYHLKYSTFHRVETYEPTVTLFVPGPMVCDYALVIRPHDNPPDICPYASTKTTEECWDIIDQMMA